MDDLVLTQLRAQRRRLGVVAVLPGKSTVNEVIAPLRGVRENGTIADPECRLGGAAESAPDVWVKARVGGRRAYRTRLVSLFRFRRASLGRVLSVGDVGFPSLVGAARRCYECPESRSGVGTQG